jgi:predicted RecA/RadA family phage recombinase
MKNLSQLTDAILQFLASDLTAPSHSSGDSYTNIAGPQQGLNTPINLVEGGDPVVCGRIVGVADHDALTSSDLITVYTRGVFNLAVTVVHNGFSKGETVYIDPSSAVLSDDQTKTPFGVALDATSVNATIRVMLFGATPGATGAGS